MKKIILLILFTSALSAQTFASGDDFFLQDSSKSKAGNLYLQSSPEPPPAPPAPIDPLELFGMSEKDEAKALQKFSESEIKDLKKIKEKNKIKYYELLNEKRFRFSYRFEEMPKEEKAKREEEEKRENNILKLDIATEALAIDYQNAKEAQREKIKSELRSKLNNLFDLKEQDKKNEVEELEKRLKELKASLETRQKNKSEIVNRRLRELTGENKYLRWD